MGSKASSVRLIHEVSDTDDNGILVDLLGHTLRRMTVIGRVAWKWSVFDLDWMQRADGLFDWGRVCKRSVERPDGWQLDDSGIRLFHAQSTQVTDGLFLAGSQHTALPDGKSYEYAIQQSELALQAFDAGWWRLSCSDEQLARDLLGGLERVASSPLIERLPGS